MIAFAVNSPLVSARSIKLKYFEPGHTFMAADNVHAAIERQMRHNKVHDFNDFLDCLKKANCDAHEMVFSDFHAWEKGVSEYKLKKKRSSDLLERHDYSRISERSRSSFLHYRKKQEIVLKNWIF